MQKVLMDLDLFDLLRSDLLMSNGKPATRSHFRIHGAKPKLAKITSFNVTVDRAISASRDRRFMAGQSVSQHEREREGWQKIKIGSAQNRLTQLNSAIHSPSLPPSLRHRHANSAILRAKICPKIRWAIFRENRNDGERRGWRIVVTDRPTA